MDSALAVHRLHFAFTVTFHYLFPQLTMGLALLIVILKTAALRTGDEHYNQAARFWVKIFAINFAMGVVTGIPMEFQFGTNWVALLEGGGRRDRTDARHGGRFFSSFWSRPFLGLFVFGEKRLSPRMHWLSAVTGLRGGLAFRIFIIATDAWMQHPTAYKLGPQRPGLARKASGDFHESMDTLAVPPQHDRRGSDRKHRDGIHRRLLFAGRAIREHARIFVRTGVVAGTVATLAMIFPTGDGQGKMIAAHQPVTLAAMEGLFDTTEGAPIALIGQPNTDTAGFGQSHCCSQDAQFSDLPPLGSGGEGLEGFPTRSVARQHSTAVLQLSHHGGNRNHAYCLDADMRVVDVALAALWKPALAVGIDAGASVSLISPPLLDG